MKYLGLVAVPLAIASWYLVGAIAHYGEMPGFPLLRLYANSMIVTKLMTNLLILGLLAALVLIVMYFAKRTGADRGPLIGLFFGGVGVGLLSSAYGFLNIHIAMVRTNTTNLHVVAPSAAEALIPISVGLTIAAFCGLAIAFGPQKRSAP